MVGDRGPTVILMIFSSSLSLGPLKAKIQVFSGSLSENDRKSINERDHKFYCTLVIFECAVNFFFPTWKNVPGAYSERFSDIIGHREHPENTLKRRFLSKKKGRKRVKEWREVTFMKEWVKALDNMRILAPADLR